MRDPLMLLVTVVLGTARCSGMKNHLHFSWSKYERRVDHPNYEKSYFSAKKYYFDQRIDHFSFANTQTYKQMYFVDDRHWNNDGGGGPIFYFVGCEGPVFPSLVCIWLFTI